MSMYNIANINIKIVSKELYEFKSLAPFELKDKKRPDLIINMQSCDHIYRPEGKLLLDEDIKWVSRYDNNNICIYITDINEDKITYMLEVDCHWTNATISLLKDVAYGEYAIAGPFGQVLFRSHILFHHGIVIHASAIKHKGMGIMFSAPSGTGKSTQANLWRSYKEAIILNGDRPAVKFVDSKSFVYGIPWSGSSNEFINKRAPLSAIVMLEQSQENLISKLSYHEAVKKLMPRCFLPYYDSRLMNIAINNLERIINSTPVYLLKCRPDKEAVDLLYETLMQDYKEEL